MKSTRLVILTKKKSVSYREEQSSPTQFFLGSARYFSLVFRLSVKWISKELHLYVNVAMVIMKYQRQS